MATHKRKKRLRKNLALKKRKMKGVHPRTAVRRSAPFLYKNTK